MKKNNLIQGWQPTEKQKCFVDGLISGLNITDAAAAAGCSRITWYTNWQNNPDFRNYLESRRAGEALVQLPAVDRAVFKKAKEGDIAAAKLIYEVFGELRVRSLQLINNRVSFDFSKMTTVQLKKEAAKLAEELQILSGNKEITAETSEATNVQIVPFDSPSS